MPTNSPLYAPFSWRAALAASATGGLVFAVLHIGLLRAVHGVSPSVPIRMIAAIVLGPGALSSTDRFDPVVLLVAISIHGILSIVYGTFLALLLPAANAIWSILIGGLYGLILYYINFYGLNPFSPWFIEERDTMSMVSHLVFGAVVASAYRAFHPRWYAEGSEHSAPSEH